MKNLLPPQNYAAETLVEMLEDHPVSQKDLAEAVGIKAPIITYLKKGERPFNAEHDLRLCKYFGFSEGYFLRLQTSYELEKARYESYEEIERIAPFQAA